MRRQNIRQTIIAVPMPRELRAYVEQKANDEARSMSSFIRRCIEFTRKAEEQVSA
jgi:hypothetical protein